MPAIKAKEIIRLYDLLPHPEGGHYRQTYRSAGIISARALPGYFAEDKAYATAIFYLLQQGESSRLHRLKQDELWHFYLGGTLRLITISPKGKYSEFLLGQNILAGEQVQLVVSAGYWFGAAPAPGSPYSFAGCTVSPGFDFSDLEFPRPGELESSFPHLQGKLEQFTLKI